MRTDDESNAVSMPVAQKARARALLGAYVLQDAGASRGRRVTRGAVVLAITCFLGLGATAAGAYVAFGPASDQRSAMCFTIADRVPEGGDYGTTVAVAQAEGPGGEVLGTGLVDDPVAFCRDAWEVGLLRPGALEITHPEALPPGLPRRFEAPQLTACVLNTGQAGVFPAGPEVCGRLGLTSLSD